MKYTCTVLAVKDIHKARKFYEDVFGLELEYDYGINISFTCGISLQQEFDWLVGLPKDKILTKSNNAELCFEEKNFDSFINSLKQYPDIVYVSDVIEHGWGQRVIRFYDLDGHIIEVGENMKMVVQRFLNTGMTMEEVSKRMDVTLLDLTKLLNE